MPYDASSPRVNSMLLRAHACPYLVSGTRCAGGDYCPFPPGEDHLCCFFCPYLDDCPDPSGICVRLQDG